MFDFPSTYVDYVHRAGRTARNGSSGLVTSLYSKRDAELANMIQQSALKSSTSARRLLEPGDSGGRPNRISKVSGSGGNRSSPRV